MSLPPTATHARSMAQLGELMHRWTVAVTQELPSAS